MHNVSITPHMKSLGLKGMPTSGEIPVAEAQFVLVEERGLYDFRLEVEGGKQLKPYHIKIQGLYFKPILISLTENTSGEECWYYNHVFKTLVFGVSTGYAKILALPEHFSPKHLQATVDDKLKDRDKVLIECEDKYNEDQSLADLQLNGEDYFKVVKLNPSNQITLHKIEEKMYTKTELIQIANRYAQWYQDNKHTFLKSKQDQWFEQNVK